MGAATRRSESLVGKAKKSWRQANQLATPTHYRARLVASRHSSPSSRQSSSLASGCPAPTNAAGKDTNEPTNACPPLLSPPIIDNNKGVCERVPSSSRFGKENLAVRCVNSPAAVSDRCSLFRAVLWREKATLIPPGTSWDLGMLLPARLSSTMSKRAGNINASCLSLTSVAQSSESCLATPRQRAEDSNPTCTSTSAAPAHQVQHCCYARKRSQQLVCAHKAGNRASNGAPKQRRNKSRSKLGAQGGFATARLTASEDLASPQKLQNKAKR